MSERRIANELLAAPSNDRIAAWRLANEMVLAGWTVYGSSNGTTFNTSGTNQWVTSYATSAANTGAWIALSRPGASQGFCFHIVTSTTFRITYTISGWASAGASATVAPLAVATTHYICGTSGAGRVTFFQSAGTMDCARLNMFIADPATDGSVILYGFAAGVMTSLFVYTLLTPVTPSIIDPYAFFIGQPIGGFTRTPAQRPDYFYDSAGLQWQAVGPTGVITNCTAGWLTNASTGTLIGNDSATRNAFVGATTYVLNPILVQTQIGAGTTQLGFTKWVFWSGSVGTSGDFFSGSLGTYSWVKWVGASNAILPWDGVATSLLTS